MKTEYRMIVDAGFVLQIDDPRMVTEYDSMDPPPTPEEYRRFVLSLKKGEKRNRDRVVRQLVDMQYERNDIDFTRGRFRIISCPAPSPFWERNLLLATSPEFVNLPRVGESAPNR